MRRLSLGGILFWQFLLLYLLISFYFAYILQIYHNDAISRTALAFFTVFGRDPHLGAIGFVWQPLPSLLQIPFLILLRPLGYMMMAGPIITSFCGAFSVFFIFKIGKLLIKEKRSILPFFIALLFGLNPLIMLYSAIGTSEMVFFVCLIAMSFFMIRFFYTHNQMDFLLASLFISLSFWSRYEAIPAFFGTLALITAQLFRRHNSVKPIESTLLQYSLPFFYSVGLWILANWLIMKDPLYFMNSPYSNASFTENFKTNPTLLDNSYHSFISSFIYAFKRVFFVSPVISLIPFSIIPFLFKKYRESHVWLLPLFLTFPYLGIILFHVYQLFKGESFGWLRFFIYGIALGTLLTIYFSYQHKYLCIASVLLLLLSIYTTTYAMSNPAIGREEHSFIEKIANPNAPLDFSRTYQDQKEVAAVMDNVDGTILIDTDKGFAVPLFAKDPNRFIITSDIDYLAVVQNYSNYVKWVILPQPAADDRGQNKIYTYYPGIWNGNAPNLTLYKQIDGWRIFQVNQPSTTPP